MTSFLIALWVRSLLLAAGGGLLLALMRRCSASVRHAVVAATLVAMLLLPLLGWLMPGRTEAVLPQAVVIRLAPVFAAPATAGRSLAPFQYSGKASEHVEVLALLWALGSTLILFRIGGQLYHLARRIRASRPVTGTERVRFDPDTQVPLTAWWGTHYVLVPEAWSNWDSALKQSVLRHEEAHIQRGDWLLRLIGQAAVAFLWPNPASWLLARYARELSEGAADDAVLASGVPASQYSMHLLTIAHSARRPTPEWAVPMFNASKTKGSEVSRRIEMILDEEKSRSAVTPRGVMAVGMGVLVMAVPLAGWALGPVPVIQGKDPKKHVFAIHARVMRTEQPKYVRSTDANGHVTGKAVSDKPLPNSKLLMSPTVVTMEHSPATIQLEGPNSQMSMTFEPYYDAKGIITVKVQYKVREGARKPTGSHFTLRQQAKMPMDIVLKFSNTTSDLISLQVADITDKS